MTNATMIEILGRLRRLAPWGVAIPLLAVAFGCGGGDGGGGGGDLTATFTPDAPSPGALSVSLQPGTEGTQFSVIVSVKEIGDFFGAAFSVSYPILASGQANVDFLGADTSGSFLNGTGIQTWFVATDVNHTGVVDVVATRLQDAPGTVPGVDVGTTPMELLRLNFQVRRSMTDAAIDFTGIHKVCNSQSAGNPPVCVEIQGVTWSGGKVSAH